MTKIFALMLSFFIMSSSDVLARDPEKCRVVRLADIGWTDVTSTTAVAEELLRALNYDPKVSVLSTPVTFAALKNNDIDVFLGNWMPTQEGDIRRYLDEGSVVQLGRNLEGALFTLAVPDYVYDAGVRTFADLVKFGDHFKKLIYGIEPGNDGNRLILQMISEDAFGLKDFRVVESSEQGMLVAVKDAVSRGDFIVFLGWAPHPMNLAIKMRYLQGGDQYFGPRMGASQVFTTARRDFASDCPNLARFFGNLVFSVPMENQIMGLILNEQQAPKIAANRWLRDHHAKVRVWLDGVMAYDGTSGQTAYDVAMAPSGQKEAAHASMKAPLGEWMELGITTLTNNFAPHFRAFSHAIEWFVDGTVETLLMVHWGILIAIFAVLAYLLHRSFKLVALVIGGLLLIVNLGLWVETIETLVLVMFATFVSIMVGVPLGILAARRPWFDSALRPILDLMQTIPTFVYLIPTLMLFGLGLVPGLISTIIFSVAAPIRLTSLGIKNVPLDLIEASEAFGATKTQTLIKVELPHALPSIMAGFTQCIMLSLSMVVIAALVGADGLGTPVVRALNTVNIKQGFESGIAIVILAILLDRTLSIKNKRSPVNGA